MNITQQALRQNLKFFCTFFLLPLIVDLLLLQAAPAAGSMNGVYIEIGNTRDAYRQFVQNMSERVLLPTFQTFDRQSQHLMQSSQQFCNGGRNNDQFDKLRASWNTTIAAWIQTQPFRFGPAIEDFIDLKIQFWPDDKGLVSNRVSQLLNNGQQINVATIANSSAPAQGLPAIEYLLFDSEHGFSAFNNPETGNRHCEYLLAATENLHNQAKSITAAWGNSSQGFLSSFAYNDNSIQTVASFSTLLREMLVSLEFVKNIKVGKPFGLPTGSTNKLFLESWRSEHSLDNIIVNINALQRFYYGGNYHGVDDILIGTYHNNDLEFAMRTQLEKCLALANAISNPIENKVQDAEIQTGMNNLFLELIKLIALIKNDLAQVVGITIGFSSNDGD